jgi:hypothetical protein
MANRNFQNGGKIYSPHVMPVLIDCNFVVDSANGNGLGIRQLKGPNVTNVFMHTSATPAKGNQNQLNPNPQPGMIIVQLADNYNRVLSGFNSIVSPLSGTSLAVNATALTPNNVYVVVSVGSTTPAQFIALGVPASIANSTVGVQPGLAFVAKVSGVSSGGSALVQAASVSNITNIETIGDSNQAIAPQGTPNVGAQFILQCLKNAVVTQPADGTVISLSFYMSNSSITVQGE